MAYKFERTENGVTIITPELYHSGMPKIWAEVAARGPDDNEIAVRYGEDGTLLATATVYRGISFAERVATFMLKGCLSRLGHRRRLTANKRAREGVAI